MVWLLLVMMCLSAVYAQPATQPVDAASPATPAAQPATMPDPTVTSSPASTEPKPADDTDPRVLELLTSISERAALIKTMQAKLRYDRIMELQGDRQRRFGTLYYQAGPPAQFAIHLHQRLADSRLEPLDRWYIFDGIWLVEKIADQKPPQFIKRQVTPPVTSPDRTNETSNPLALGQGPFAIPIDFNKERILARFQVVLVDPDKENDPAQGVSVHLRLTPRQGQRMNLASMDLWYDSVTFLPLRLRTEEPDSGNVSLIDITQSRINESIDPKVLDTSEPTEAGWDVVIKPWEQD